MDGDAEMRWEDLKERFLDFAHEFRRQKTGMIGLGILLVLVSMAIAAPFIADPNAFKNWHNLKYWEENPRAVPPTWVEIFWGKKAARHEIVYGVITKNGTTIIEYNITYNYKYDLPPAGIVIKFKFAKLTNQSPLLLIGLQRPDGATFSVDKNPLTRIMITTSEYVWYISLDSKAKSSILNFARQYDPAATNLTAEILSPDLLMQILFSKAKPGMSVPGKGEPLHGKYTFMIRIYLYTPENKMEYVKAIFQGRVYGLLGTDDFGRDLWSGIVWGIWVALMIGILTSVISVFIGLTYGVTSAYLGGKWDELLQRINDIVYSMPVLPILIIMAAAWRPSVWNIVILLSIFSWPGFAKVVRSMALQIKEEPFVEAARASGASGVRIVIRHIAPQILPYTFANIALGVPGAILTEAGLSFLGLGDPTIPTWGQILHDAQARFATLRNLWWWVVIPGLMIALVGLTFALIGIAMDTILNPRLRKI